MVPTQHNNQEKVVTIASSRRCEEDAMQQIVAIRVAPREPTHSSRPFNVVKEGARVFSLRTIARILLLPNSPAQPFGGWGN